MRVITFNAGLLRGGVAYAAERVGPVATAVAGLDADVIALQELWAEDDRRSVLETAGPGHPHALEADPLPPLPGDWALDGNSGLALLSRWPIVHHNVVSLDASIVRRAIQRAVVETPAGRVTIMNTHLTAYLRSVEHAGGAGGWAAEHAAQCRVVADLARTADGPIILAGDLNCGPPRGGRAELADSYAILARAFDHSPFADDPGAGCSWCSENPLVYEEADTILDHVMVTGLRPIGWERVLTSAVEIRVDGAAVATPVSDHYGIAVDLTA